MRSQKAFLIDGTAFCYRAFYAIRSLSTSDGRPTNAVYGFVRMLQALQEKERPDYLAVAFDVGKPTFRHKQFEEYKVQRKPMPDPLVAQIPVVKAMLAAYRIPVFEREGYEAEDVLATIAKRIITGGVDVFLVTGDKDALQLVNSHIKVYNPHKEGAVLDAASVRARYGVGPERMVDLMALMGDEIDNIPGVPGIGEKTAIQLIQRFGSLEQLYEHLDDIESPGRRASLEASRKQVELSRELARINTSISLAVRLDDLRLQEPDWRALRSLFRELEFKRLLNELEARAPVPDRPATIAEALVTLHDVERCLRQLQGATAAAIGCWPLQRSKEEIGPIERGVDAIMLAVAVDVRSAWVARLDRAALSTPQGHQLTRWLEDATAQKVGHDLKRTKRLLGVLHVALQGVAGDTMIAAHLLNPARTNQTLSDLADEYLEERLTAMPLGEEPPTLDSSEALQPFAQAVCTILRLHELLTRHLHSKGLAALCTDLELPLLGVLAQMEATGITIDLPYLATLHASMEAALTQLTEEIHRLAGCDFNLNSPKQLARVLFERLNLPVVKRTKTGPSTDSDVLQQLAGHHPLPQRLMHYRELAKLVSTYVDALPQLADPKTGRLHTSFNQTATSTGRLSSSEPNLQNIPIKTELGRSIRRAFIPGIRDGVLVAADYSQIELRILAHLSGDEQLTEAFRQGRDIHRVTASLIYGLSESDVQPEQRNAMKAVNYGILYGMTSHGLSKELGIPFEEAQAFIDAYFERYPKVRGYLDRQIAQAIRDGFVQTLLGRRRYIPELHSPDAMVRQFGERMAINAPIQGTAADLIKRAMIQLAAQLEEERLSSRMVLQVHDELVFESPRAELDALVRLVRRTMEGAIALDVPLTVTVKAGPNWLDLSPLE
jgi:DNA polymerase-1